jgi:capsular exopolysaccharide synthesis family protein
MVAKSWNALAVTSGGPGQGKTLTAINLAISLSREIHHTVLLVDFDLRRPSIHRYLGLHPNHGIADYLIHDVPLNEILLNPGMDRLVVLPGKDAVFNSSEMLAAPRTAKLVEELKSRYPSRVIIFDLPPVLMVDDALAFSPFVDAVLLVVEENKATKEEIVRAAQMLSGTNVIGTVLNKSQEKLPIY